LAVFGKNANFATQRAHFRNTVQTQELPPLTWRMVAELLYA